MAPATMLQNAVLQNATTANAPIDPRQCITLLPSRRWVGNRRNNSFRGDGRTGRLMRPLVRHH